MIIIPDLFTPYIEGRERAIDRNWNDMTQFNQVQKGQLDNMEALATFGPRVNATYEDTIAKSLANMQRERINALNDILFPGIAALAAARSALNGSLAGNQAAAESAARLQATQTKRASDAATADYVRRLQANGFQWPTQGTGGATTAVPNLTGTGTAGASGIPSIPNTAKANAAAAAGTGAGANSIPAPSRSLPGFALSQTRDSAGNFIFPQSLDLNDPTLRDNLNRMRINGVRDFTATYDHRLPAVDVDALRNNIRNLQPGTYYNYGTNIFGNDNGQLWSGSFNPATGQFEQGMYLRGL